MNFSYWPLMIYLPLYFAAGVGYGTLATGLALLVYTVPFLLMPPLAQHLLMRHQARIVIPLGLATIGAGFILMWLGTGDRSGLAVLPGALIAGIGLGLTNSPVTHTATGSVSADRSGMASGIDVSARLITLAINIAVMGFVLVEGIIDALRGVLPAGNVQSLRAAAEKIAAGNLAAVAGPDEAIRAALVHGFAWVMLYGGVGVLVLAALSFAAFRQRAPQEVSCAAKS